MPYIKQAPSKKHSCDLPNPAKAIIGHGAGAVWQCSRCKTKWVLTDVQTADRPDYPNWMKADR